MTGRRDAVCPKCWTWYSATVGTCASCGVSLAAPTGDSETPAQPTHGAASTRRRSRDGTRPTRRRALRGLTLLSGVLLVASFYGLRQVGLWGNPGCGFTASTCTRILFIGNSYTYVNDLPTTFADLAWSGGHRTETESLAAGGETLAQHAADSATATMLASKQWSTVILQEQSEIPSVASYRQGEMYPAARQLVATTREAGAKPLLFLTWAHQAGWPQEALPDYVSMQAAVDAGYLGIASLLDVPIAPVGDAWRMVITEQSSPSLWQADGVHPTTAGTYLAACVFYASIFRQNPVGLRYHDGLSDAGAMTLQRAAASTVLGG